MWAWCVSNPSAPAIEALIWFPALSTLLFGLRAWGHFLQARSIRKYLARLESKLALGGDVGWEREGSHSANGLRITMGFAFWLVLQPAAVAIAHYVSTHR